MKVIPEWRYRYPRQRAPDKRVSTFILEYCGFYLSKNLPYILAENYGILFDLNNDIIWQLIRTSFNYTVRKKHIEINLRAIEIFHLEKNIYSLFNKIHECNEGRCGFDS